MSICIKGRGYRVIVGKRGGRRKAREMKRPETPLVKMMLRAVEREKERKWEEILRVEGVEYYIIQFLDSWMRKLVILC